MQPQSYCCVTRCTSSILTRLRHGTRTASRWTHLPCRHRFSSRHFHFKRQLRGNECSSAELHPGRLFPFFRTSALCAHSDGIYGWMDGWFQKRAACMDNWRCVANLYRPGGFCCLMKRSTLRPFDGIYRWDMYIFCVFCTVLHVWSAYLASNTKTALA